MSQWPSKEEMSQWPSNNSETSFLISEALESANYKHTNDTRWGLPVGFNPLVHFSMTILRQRLEAEVPENDRSGQKMTQQTKEIIEKLLEYQEKFEEIKNQILADNADVERQTADQKPTTVRLPQKYQKKIDEIIRAVEKLVKKAVML